MRPGTVGRDRPGHVTRPLSHDDRLRVVTLGDRPLTCDEAREGMPVLDAVFASTARIPLGRTVAEDLEPRGRLG